MSLARKAASKSSNGKEVDSGGFFTASEVKFRVSKVLIEICSVKFHGARTGKFPPANPAAEYRLHNARPDFVSCIGQIVRVFRTTGEPFRLCHA
jgi:hypothetical protein